MHQLQHKSIIEYVGQMGGLLKFIMVVGGVITTLVSGLELRAALIQDTSPMLYLLLLLGLSSSLFEGDVSFGLLSSCGLETVLGTYRQGSQARGIFASPVQVADRGRPAKQRRL